eukprot:TRINITY_DN16193_c0_g1_i1.p1 TRINITY_DN16193_c0_g1~~TRINITY_DN16193_c0_g1_i1.p1  ORF type:complete len:395 (+),score=78.98 TRINITY_DN16193_c0_g1_i1:329-1513(+)
MPYIGRHGLETLKRYKYSGVDKSPLAKYVFQPFWQRFVLLFPTWYAPNLITLTGFFFILLSSTISYFYTPFLDTTSPWYIYFIHGLLLFLYQTFDAVDGKQARRTNSSSPLGELFDHGCDALTTSFETLALGSTVMIGNKVMWLWATGVVPFYFATWEQYHTGCLLLGFMNGPTEGLMIIYFVHWITAIFGPERWLLDFRQVLGLPSDLLIDLVPELCLRDLCLFSMLFVGVAITVSINIVNVHKAVKEKGGSLVEAWLQVIPFLSLLAMLLIWAKLSPSDLVRNHPFLFIIGSGFVFGFLVGRMILAHLADEPKGIKTHMSTAMLFIPLGIANALTAQLFDGQPIIPEYWMLIAYNVWSVGLYFYFVSNVIVEIQQALGISAFKIKRQPEKAS